MREANPSPLPSFLREYADYLSLQVTVTTRAKRTAIKGEHGGRLKIALAAPPVDGKANECLLQFIAQIFGLPKHRVSLAQGAKSKSKNIMLQGCSAMAALERLSECDALQFPFRSE